MRAFDHIGGFAAAAAAAVAVVDLKLPLILLYPMFCVQHNGIPCINSTSFTRTHLITPVELKAQVMCAHGRFLDRQLVFLDREMFCTITSDSMYVN